MSSHIYLISFFISAEYCIVSIKCTSFNQCILTTDTLFFFLITNNTSTKFLCILSPKIQSWHLLPHFPLPIHHQVLVISPNISGTQPLLSVELPPPDSSGDSTTSNATAPYLVSSLPMSSFQFPNLQPEMQILFPSL